MTTIQTQTILPSAEISTAATRYYEDHKRRVSAYQKANPEKMREKCRKYNARVKETQPEKYEENLISKREYYHKIRKPKMLAEKAKLNSDEIFLKFEKICEKFEENVKIIDPPTTL